MSTKSKKIAPATTSKQALRVSLVFYVLIAFEFFYMASPFAIYFYSIYGPGLNWLQGMDAIHWTIQFFLPHIVEASKSPIIKVLEITGYFLFFGGLIGFSIGAFQIYRAKLLKREAVMNGLYRFIRHPQYLALIIASIGMLLIWPRYLVLFMTITVIFIYIWLAKTEEAICLKKYEGYQSYLNQTGMFLPKWSHPHFHGISLSQFGFQNRKMGKVLKWIAIYVVTLVLSVFVAKGLRSFTIANLYTLKTENSVYLSTVSISEEDLEAIARITQTTPEYHSFIKDLDTTARLLNYVLPTEMYVSEIPMHLPKGEVFGHSVPENWDKSKFKVIVTQADFGGSGLPEDGDILKYAVNKFSVIELWISLEENKVIKSFPPPKIPYYGNSQVPIF